MIRKYSLVIDGDSTGYSGYVPELPTILVTGDSIDQLTARAKEAIRIYWESLPVDRSATSTLHEVEVDVELPA
jgi:predicted RNase H-like HicB family nuclease